jgi:DMSO/TMAO reductase YedYZ heme-binding membrane subunit
MDPRRPHSGTLCRRHRSGAYRSSVGSPLLLVRLFALWGFLALSIAAILTPFLRDIRRVFGRPFLAVHHTFAAFGILLPTLHPVAFALLAASPAVFIPVFDSWTAFWTFAGRPALYLLYIALAGVLLRQTIRQYWRWVHGLMYAVLLFAIIHGNLIGIDFQNPVIFIVFNGLFAVVIAVFVVRRLQRMRAEQRRQTAKTSGTGQRPPSH